MEYLKKLLSPQAAKWYAISCCLLMTAWSGAQANQLAAIFDSHLLGDYRISPVISGFIVAILVFFTLLGGIKRISAIASKMVPLMFILFLGSSLWILLSNWEKLPATFATIVYSAFSPYAMASGTLVGGIVSALRWGILKGTQTTEAGIGTQTIPHSMTESEDAIAQGTLSMISTYTAGFMAFLSGCVVLVTDTWQDPEIPVGIGMIAASFHMYFSTIGLVVVVICTFLFAFGTILGNSYNGSRCFVYLADVKNMRYYFGVSACVIFAGAVTDVKTIWSFVDIFLVGMAVPHMYALMRYVRESTESLKKAMVSPIE
jgi:AGCS family alanine or glycine:cation symporter